MKGYNLPDNVSPSDPEAPWNEVEKEGQEDQEPDPCCPICGSPTFDGCPACEDYL
jgi:hypothetical protein